MAVEMPRPVYLRDLANVIDGFRDETSTVFVNSQAAVMMTVQKQSGKNTVQTAKNLRARLVRLEMKFRRTSKLPNFLILRIQLKIR